MNSVPASYFVSVTPQVLAAGGNGLAMVGLVLTANAQLPIGDMHSFSSVSDVSNYFGPAAAEVGVAATYFAGFDGSNIKPGSILFAQYNSAAVSGYLRSGPVGTALTLTQLKAITAGTLTLTVAGTPITSASINLSGASSFSNAATIIQAAFTTPPFAVSYDPVSAGFVFTTTATGATATVTFCTGTNNINSNLMLTAATGAVLSQGAAIAVPSTFMNGVTAITQNWATFMTMFNPDVSGNANKLLFAQWVATQNDKYMYVCGDTDTTPTTTLPATASLGYLLDQAGTTGTCLIYQPTGYLPSAFVCGMVASIDFDQTAGNVNPAYKSQSGLVPDVTSETVLSNLEQNGYNCYLASATAAQGFQFFWNGQLSGPWLWMQPYINQIWLNSQFQLDLMLLLTQLKSIPYNSVGETFIHNSLMDTITAALNFGAIQPGVNLSALQIAEVNAAAGQPIDQVLSTRGWYLQVLQASPTVRQNRGSPPCNFWYTDGGSVNHINLASIDLL